MRECIEKFVFKIARITNSVLDPLVFDGGFALTGTQASLQTFNLLSDASPVSAHHVHHLGVARSLMFLYFA